MRAEVIPETLWPRLSELIAEKTGLHFPPERRPDLQRGLIDAAAEFGFADTASCVDWLLSVPLTGPQLHTLASHLTVGETYFFRDRKAFDALAQSILPELIRRRRGSEQRLRFWSAACCTGEEPYSLAILLDELLPDWDDWHVTILATDINSRFLQKAVTGVYGEWSFRETPVEVRDRYFTSVADRRFALAPHIRNRVTFAQMNLSQDGFPSLATDTNAMDVILCRNVLIYFTQSHVRKLVENLHHALVDEGLLAVSPSECSHVLFSRFAVVNFPGAILYRKSKSADQPIPGRSPGPETDVARASPDPRALVLSAPAVWVAQRPKQRRVEPEAQPAAPSDPVKPAGPCATAEALYAQGRYAEAANTLLISFAPTLPVSLSSSRNAASPQTTLPGAASAEALSLQAPSPRAFSVLARSLANLGQLREALTWCERWIAADKLDASAHYLHAMVAQELGEALAARSSLQRALYLQADFALAHFALGNCALADTRGAEASRHFKNALRLLRARPPDEPVPESEGLTAGRLAEIISSLLGQGASANERSKR